MAEIRYYNPSNIFVNNNRPERMAGAANFALARSFVLSRDIHDNRAYVTNAGAVALYHRNGIIKYMDKEYDAISDRIEGTTYGHTERKLIMDLLDDLISTNPNDKFRVPRLKSIQWRDGQQAALEYLTDNAAMYKRYLEEKGIIVKMWSERKPCNYTYEGGPCEDFLRNICPEGSQIGYIVENHRAPEETRVAIEICILRALMG
ncbi:uncharacterized protein LOC106649487 isoform X2 [Trichogramma pretiosum]|uniref:uncharacterized protein LOC106649487 isoform X2 n=1 Tax=Trichogramma pretiosum TaxID=7493 RepID=UPI000C718AF7|nr:uncharacterized protein LOC106649487 isoform X2 [Trichogramma pretiosum]